jgi:hypothetical protein
MPRQILQDKKRGERHLPFPVYDTAAWTANTSELPHATEQVDALLGAPELQICCNQSALSEI